MKKSASLQRNKNKFLIFGCGFSGSFFAKKIKQLGYTALTSSRSEKKDPDSFLFNSEIGIIPTKKTFDGVTHILSCIPPDKNGKDPVLSSLKDQLKSLSLEWVGYLSTTGVYGNTKGDWVSEIDEPNPFQKGSQKRLNCEKEWIDSGLPVQIFRLPGIYGPGRSTFETIKNKKIRVITKKNQVFSRIHVADITNAIIYLLENKNSLKFHQIINIADDEPCSQIEVMQYCYNLIGLQCQNQFYLRMQKRNYHLSLNLFGWKIEEFRINFYAKNLDIN